MASLLCILLFPVVVGIGLVLYDYWGTRSPGINGVGGAAIQTRSRSLSAFRTLPPPAQWAAVAGKGTLLARRRAGQQLVSLYDLPGGVFCEVYRERETMKVVRINSFTSTALLGTYTAAVGLADLNEPTY